MRRKYISRLPVASRGGVTLMLGSQTGHEHTPPYVNKLHLYHENACWPSPAIECASTRARIAEVRLRTSSDARIQEGCVGTRECSSPVWNRLELSTTRMQCLKDAVTSLSVPGLEEVDSKKIHTIGSTTRPCSQINLVTCLVVVIMRI